jgi:hypothetical protein
MPIRVASERVAVSGDEGGDQRFGDPSAVAPTPTAVDELKLVDVWIGA